MTPNLRADRRAISRKLGIIAGDGCFFGRNTRFNPGDHFLPSSRLV